MKWKILLYIGLSLAMSGGVCYLLYEFVDTLYRKQRDSALFPWIDLLRSEIGTVPVVISAVLFFFIIFYITLMTLFLRRISRITRDVQKMANGDLTTRIKVSGKDELGNLEYNINYMVDKLSRSMEEERLAERTKAELITNVSHDLRTPLTSIIGYLGLVEQDRYRDEVELRHYIHIAYEKAERLHLMIEDLFEFTRMSGGAPIAKQPVRMNDLISQMYVHYLQPMADVGLDLRMNIPEESLVIQGDSMMLVRVLDNLLTNAMKYGREGRSVDLIMKALPAQVQIEVINYGDPIPETDLPHIFDRFYRADKSRGSDVGGSGLGLAISRAIIEQHGGMIKALSDDKSTRFIVNLPLTAGCDE